MPFTPSHALVALPFLRTPLVPAAIAIGAMTPDLPLFTCGIPVSYEFTHDPANATWTALIALVLLVVWWLVLRPALVELSPDALASRLPATWRLTGLPAARELIVVRRRPMHSAWVAISLFLGVFSHILWDSFSHEGRWGVETFPALQQQWGPMPGYKWVQHGSSVVALLILGICAVVWLRRRPAVVRPRLLPAWARWAWYLSLPLLLIGGWMLGLTRYGQLSADLTVQQLAYRTLPGASGLWGALTLVLCFGIVIRRMQRR